MKLLTVVAKVIAKNEFTDEVGMNLRKLLFPTRSENGCVNYDLHRSIENPAIYIFHENWKSKSHLDAHLQSQHLTSCMDNIKHMIEGLEVYQLEVIENS